MNKEEKETLKRIEESFTGECEIHISNGEKGPHIEAKGKGGPIISTLIGATKALIHSMGLSDKEYMELFEIIGAKEAE